MTFSMSVLLFGLTTVLASSCGGDFEAITENPKKQTNTDDTDRSKTKITLDQSTHEQVWLVAGFENKGLKVTFATDAITEPMVVVSQVSNNILSLTSDIALKSTYSVVIPFAVSSSISNLSAAVVTFTNSQGIKSIVASETSEDGDQIEIIGIDDWGSFEVK